MTTTSPAPRLFLHVGPEKTGTSAIQHILRQHDDTVVCYPKVGLWADGAHHNLVLNFFQNFSRPEVERIDLDGAFAEIGAGARRSGKSVVISSEGLFRRDAGRFLEALLKAIGAPRDEAEIVVVHREPFARAASIYNQAVKDPHTRETRRPGDFLRAAAKDLLYAPILVALGAAGVRVQLMGYEPSQDFVARFLGHIGFTAAETPKNEKRNVSLSVHGLIATLAANRVARSVEHRKRLFEAIRRQPRFFAPTRFIFDLKTARAIEPLFRDDCERLAADWGFTATRLDLAGKEDAFALSHEDAARIERACEPLEPGDRAAMHGAIAEFIVG
jgi:hypothetical protein